MEKAGQVQITIKGRKGNFDLNPENYDIKEIIEVLQNVDHLLSPNSKKLRPIISYDIADGSVKHIFKTTLQTVILLNALLMQIKTDDSIDFLEPQTAQVFEFFQQEAQKNNFEYEIKTSISDESTIIINSDTHFIRSEEVWVDAEFYFYGKIVDWGGKGKANIHLDTKEYGTLTIDVSKEFITNYEHNPIYKPYGIRAKGKQSIKSADLDKKSLVLIDIIDYNPSFKEDYLNSLINKAKKSWAGVTDADEWLQNVRGYGA